MVEVRVCIGTSCHLNGSYNVVQGLQQLIEENSLHDKINLEALFCMKQCQCEGVSIQVNEDKYRLLPENVNEFFKESIMTRIQIKIIGLSEEDFTELNFYEDHLKHILVKIGGIYYETVNGHMSYEDFKFIFDNYTE